MLKTARLSTPQSISAWMVIILAFLVCSLAVHFLVEDGMLLSGVLSGARAVDNSMEQGHQDDAAVTAGLWQQVSANPIWLGFAVILSLETRTIFPFLHPPKIY